MTKLWLLAIIVLITTIVLLAGYENLYNNQPVVNINKNSLKIVYDHIDEGPVLFIHAQQSMVLVDPKTLNIK